MWYQVMELCLKITGEGIVGDNRTMSRGMKVIVSGYLTWLYVLTPHSCGFKHNTRMSAGYFIQRGSDVEWE